MFLRVLCSTLCVVTSAFNPVLHKFISRAHNLQEERNEEGCCFYYQYSYLFCLASFMSNWVIWGSRLLFFFFLICLNTAFKLGCTMGEQCCYLWGLRWIGGLTTNWEKWHIKTALRFGSFTVLEIKNERRKCWKNLYSIQQQGDHFQILLLLGRIRSRVPKPGAFLSHTWANTLYVQSNGLTVLHAYSYHLSIQRKAR